MKSINFIYNHLAVFLYRSVCIVTLTAFVTACAVHDDRAIGVNNNRGATVKNCVGSECEPFNILAVKKIYNDVINKQRVSLLGEIFASNVISNNPNIESGVEGFKTYYNKLLADNPSMKATPKHIVSDGEYVAVHWHYSATPDNEKSGFAKVDLLKLNEGLIVEYWDVSMKALSQTKSGNSAFSDLYNYGNTQANNSPEVEEKNKATVANFYTKAFNDRDLELFDLLVDTNYIQHNQRFPNGSKLLRNAVDKGLLGTVKIFLSLADNDIVWTFRRSGDGNLSVVDLWRFDNNTNKIVEHWDVL